MKTHKNSCKCKCIWSSYVKGWGFDISSTDGSIYCLACFSLSVRNSLKPFLWVVIGFNCVWHTHDWNSKSAFTSTTRRCTKPPMMYHAFRNPRSGHWSQRKPHMSGNSLHRLMILSLISCVYVFPTSRIASSHGATATKPSINDACCQASTIIAIANIFCAQF